MEPDFHFLSGPDLGRLFSVLGDCCNLNDYFNKNSKLLKVCLGLTQLVAQATEVARQVGWRGQLSWLRGQGLLPAQDFNSSPMSLAVKRSPFLGR